MPSNASENDNENESANEKSFAAKAEEKWSKAANSYARYFEPMTVTAGRFLLSLVKLRSSFPDDNDIIIINNNNNNNNNDDDEDSSSSSPLPPPRRTLRVLEAGCGAGGLARELLLEASAPDSSLSISELVLTDLSEGMLERARAAIGAVTGCANSGGNSCGKVSDGNFNGNLCGKSNGNSNGKSNGKSNGPRVTLEAADFSRLRDKYPAGSFDRYVSNLCLHYAEDPDVVIAEAARVLKPGGIAGFTVWGERSSSPAMTIVPDVLEEFAAVRIGGGGSGSNKDSKDSSSSSNHTTTPTPTPPPSPPKQRSSFHMGEDDAALRRRFLYGASNHNNDGDDDGEQPILFRSCTVVHYPAVLESLDAEAYAEAILDGAPSTRKDLEDHYSPEDRKRIRERVRETAAARLERGEPIVLDLAVVVAQK